MLLTSARMRPCAARSGPRLPLRSNTITSLPSSVACLISIALWRGRFKVPLGPLTVTVSVVIDTVTPFGISTGLRPMRDIGLPDLAEDFAADAFFTGGAVGHHAMRRGDDGDPEAIADLRNVFRRNVRALAGARHA